MTKITVVTPCHNSARFIRETVRSVQQQDIAGWKYILVDDGSTDATPEILREVSQADDRISIALQEKAGASKARNVGAAMCAPESEYLLFLDSDDMLEPSALRILSEYLDKNAEVCVVGCQFQQIDRDGNPEPSSGRSRWVPSWFGLPRPLRSDEYDTPFVTFYCATGQGPFAMFRRSVYEQAGGWTMDFFPHEDTDLFCKMALLGKVHYLPGRLYRKRVHPDTSLQNYPRLVHSYDSFRQKWDSFQPRNAEEAATLREASLFYHGSFRPLRNIKVGAKALGEGKLRWAMTLFAGALRDIIHYRLRFASL